MNRTTIMLPNELKHAAQLKAKEQGLSFGEFVRRSMKQALSNGTNDRAKDPLFADSSLYEEDMVTDVAEKHDDYLYRDSP